jgi:hypothetical protein
LSANSLSSTLRQGGHTVSKYEARFMELLWYAPHLNIEDGGQQVFVRPQLKHLCEGEDPNTSEVSRCSPEGPHR